MKKIYRYLALVLLIGIAVHRIATAHAPPGVDRYQQNIRVAAEKLPIRIGPWIGEDVPVPYQATALLRPNALVSRHYLNIETGASVNVLFVHCSDAHAMAGHFPLRCYPANGWLLPSENDKYHNGEPRDWLAGNLRITGTEYRFHMAEIGSTSGERSIVVANCILRPNGQILRDMDSMMRSIIGAGGQSTGSGQIQISFDSSVPKEQRDATVVTFINGYMPLINAVLANPVN